MWCEKSWERERERATLVSLGTYYRFSMGKRELRKIYIGVTRNDTLDISLNYTNYVLLPE